jgi:hypothetical protein
LPVIAQKHPPIPDFNAAWPAEMALSQPTAQRGQPGANPKICRSSRRHAQQIVWSIDGLSNLTLYNFDDL